MHIEFPYNVGDIVMVIVEGPGRRQGQYISHPYKSMYDSSIENFVIVIEQGLNNPILRSGEKLRVKITNFFTTSKGRKMAFGRVGE